MKYFKWPLYAIGLLVTMIATPIIVSFMLKGFLCWKEPIAGPVTAIAVVYYSYLLAPNYNAMLSVIGFTLGALLANAIPDMHWYPECHELAYQRTYIPLAFTYAAGFVVLAYCIYLSKIKHNKSLNQIGAKDTPLD